LAVLSNFDGALMNEVKRGAEELEKLMRRLSEK
jgi:hypothetical protein